MIHRLTIGLSLLVLCLFSVGCGASASMVNGRVIKGDLSFILVVDASDPRLKEPGLAGANVAMSNTSASGGASIARVTSDSVGNVALPVRDTAALFRPAVFTAELEGYQRTTSEMSIPPTNKRVLVILKPTGPGAGT
jgi:hypothetical protein